MGKSSLALHGRASLIARRSGGVGFTALGGGGGAGVEMIGGVRSGERASEIPAIRAARRAEPGHKPLGMVFHQDGISVSER